jgi:hypothetical protein
MVAMGNPRNICSGYYALNNSDSYSRLPSDVNQVVWFLFHEILVLVFLPMSMITLMDIRMHKILKEPPLIFEVYGLIYVPIFFGCRQNVIEEQFEDLQD